MCSIESRGGNAAIRIWLRDNGQEIHPHPHPQSVVYRELSKATVDADIALLAARGMVRKSGNVVLAPGATGPEYSGLGCPEDDRVAPECPGDRMDSTSWHPETEWFWASRHPEPE
jgi:hypothetical protein